ncbi:MAG: ATP-binding protein [Oligoflexia bacterium]|nr:ATP-binding protein [Oligoflexia bacterium]
MSDLGAAIGTRLYSPWTDPPELLRQRHVGREESLSALRGALAQWAAGGRPLPVYLYGPRGVGKSHLITMARREAEALLPPAIQVRSVPEDVPSPRSGDEFWARLVGDPVPAWERWQRLATVPNPVPPLLVFVEALDRRLDDLGSKGRMRLRALLRDHPQVGLIGAGARLSDVFIRNDEAFYGSFAVYPLGPLSDDEATALIEHQVASRPGGDDVLASSRWDARRSAIVTLSGGNPRALVALSDAVAAAPGQEVAQRLLHVLDAFTPQYQLRVRDLTKNEQHLVDLLASAPRALGPTDCASALGGIAATWSSAASRLEDQGVLRIDHQGRRAFYSITETLFRHWLEYRMSPPERTRIAWLGQLLERVLGPDEMVEALQIGTSGASDTVRTAALAATGRHPSALQVWTLAMELPTTTGSAAGLLAPAMRKAGCPNLSKLLNGLNPRQPVGIRDVLRNLLRPGNSELRNAGAQSEGLALATSVALPALFDLAIRKMDRRGQPWRLRPAERSRLAHIPGLRVRFFRHGRNPNHASLVDASELLGANLSASDPDLPELLWASMAKQHHALSGLVIQLIAAGNAPRLPWCPWPGRLLRVDTETLADVLTRWHSRERLLWLGAMAHTSQEIWGSLVDSIESHPVAAPPRTRSYELSLSRVLTTDSKRLQQLAAVLGAEWDPLLDRVRLLVSQLDEAQRGPLHPELARIRYAVQSDLRM